MRKLLAVWGEEWVKGVRWFSYLELNISHSRIWRIGTVSVRDDGEASATAVFVLLYKAWLPFLLLHHNVTKPHKRGTVNEGREGGRRRRRRRRDWKKERMCWGGVCE